MRNLLAFAFAFAVVLTEEDIDALGYEPTEEQFKEYFGIPAEAVSGEYKHTENFNGSDLEDWMNEDEKQAASTTKSETGNTETDENTAEATTDAPAAEPKKETPAEAKARKAAEKQAAADAKNKVEITQAHLDADPKLAETQKVGDKMDKKLFDKRAKEKAKEDKAAQSAAPKKAGVIQTIFLAIAESETPVTQEQILERLKKDFPDKTADSMMNTIKAQVGSKQRPMRMETEKKITFEIVDEVKAVAEVKAVPANGEKPAVEAVPAVEGKPRTYFLKDAKYRTKTSQA